MRKIEGKGKREKESLYKRNRRGREREREHKSNLLTKRMNEKLSKKKIRNKEKIKRERDCT